MNVQKFMLVWGLSTCLTFPLSAGTERGNRLLAESGGAQGIAGVAGPAGAPGIAGAAGAQGIQGIPGIPGAPGILDFSDFYALMPGDNPATVAVNSAIQFPQTGSTTGAITRQGASSSIFVLPTIGTYLVQFQASIAESGQLALRLNGVPDPITVVGRSTGTDQIIGKSFVTTTSAGTTIEVINYTSAAALTLTPIAGGTQSVSAHLTIIRVQ